MTRALASFGYAGLRWPSWSGGWVCVALLILMTAAAPAAESKRVLLLDSFGRELAPWSEYSRAIRTELGRQAQMPLEIFELSYVAARAGDGDDDADSPFADYLEALFAKRPPDLIVTVGAPAADFVQRYRRWLFPSTPMLLTTVEQRRISPSSITPNDTVVAISLDLRGVVENILQVLPETETVAIVIGDSPLEKFWVQELRTALHPLENRIKFLWYNDQPFDGILKQAAALPPKSAIFFVMMAVDAAGIPQDEGNALTSLRAVANAPIFSYVDAVSSGRVVGGPLIAVSDVSYQAASVAVRILGGEAPADIKTKPIGFGTPQYDWREMQRWGISEARLPAGSEIEFRDPTVWEQYQWELIIAAAVFVLQFALIAGLLYERKRRRKAEVDARHLLLELAHMNRYATAGELSGSIAHELNQPLGAILNNTEAAEVILSNASPDLKEVKDILADIRRDDRRASEVIRRLRSMHKKAPLETEDVDIGETIREVCSFMSVLAASRNVTLTSTPASQIMLVRGDQVQIQQVVLNLIVNGIDSVASANRQRGFVSCIARQNGTSAEISITDSGSGIPADRLDHVFEPFFTTKKEGIGMGLSIARTIVEAHQGRIWAENNLEGGAVLRFSLPLAKAH